MAKPTVKQLADSFEVTYSVPKAALSASPKMAEILHSVHRQNLATMSNEQQAVTADDEIARLTAVKTEVIPVPVQVGP